MIQIWISLSATPLAPERKLKLQRSKQQAELAQKDLALFRSEINGKSPKAKVAANDTMKFKQDKMVRLRSRVNINNQKLTIAQQIDSLEKAKEAAKGTEGAAAKIKGIQKRIDGLKKRSASLKPLKRKGGAKKTVQRKVWVKN